MTEDREITSPSASIRTKPARVDYKGPPQLIGVLVRVETATMSASAQLTSWFVSRSNRAARIGETLFEKADPHSFKGILHVVGEFHFDTAYGTVVAE